MESKTESKNETKNETKNTDKGKEIKGADKCSVVVAIDFGTANSGFAYGLVHRQTTYLCLKIA